MQSYLEGTFHFHSTYSHDGRSTLQEVRAALRFAGYDFCVMTEHFEDLTEESFRDYLEELRQLSGEDFTFVPGVEVHLSGIDTLLFPVADYAELRRFECGEGRLPGGVCKVVAHPSKYHFEDVVQHLGRYPIDGIELWNQQADGRYLPPTELLQRLRSATAGRSYRYFFGCDLHSATLKVTNTLRIAADTPRNAEAIGQILAGGTFVCRNGETGIEYRNGAGADEYGAWVDGLGRRSYVRGKVLRSVRRCLRSIYRGLPRDTQKSLNNFKNLVRNKI